MTDRKALSRHLGRQGSEDAAADKIFVRDLVLACQIGAYEEEKGITQNVGFTVEATVRASGARLGDELANVPSYDDIIKIILAAAGAGHINLVETLAESIAERCLNDERISSVFVRVEKLERGPRAVGVEIVRPRGR